MGMSDYTMVIESVLLIVAAYLVGSIPAAHLAAQWLTGADLRQYGSGTVSGSMVYEHVAKWAVVPVGLFDTAKAAFPAWLGLQLGLGTQVAVAAGLAAAYLFRSEDPMFISVVICPATADLPGPTVRGDRGGQRQQRHRPHRCVA
jgi:hypothetical protein